MWREISFADVDTGAPLADLLVSRAPYYRDADPVLSGVSSVADLGGGLYGLTVDDAQADLGVVVILDAGPTAEPRYRVEAFSFDGLFAFLVLDEDGALYTDAGVPSVSEFVGSNGIDRSAPALVDLSDLIAPGQHHLWIGEATDADLAIGVAVRIDLPADTIPEYYAGQLEPGTAVAGGTPPVVTVISPTPGATIGKSDPWVVDVTDESGLLREVVLLAKFPDAGVWEVIHDGNAFGPLYPAGRNERTPIALGFRFTTLRRGGWPPGGPATLRAIAIDTTGDEA